MSTLDQQTLSIIEELSINEDKFEVYIKKQLNRKEYEKVNTVLTRLNGKWNSKRKSHQFPINPTPLLKAVLKTKEIPLKNPTAFFPTPKELVLEMIEISQFVDLSTSEFINDFRILEPSAGVGGIADCIKEKAPYATLDLVEYLPLNQQLLKEKGYQPYCGDFLEFNKNYEIKYDYIYMNPPFSVESDKKAYITHVMHAFKMLKTTGILMAIVPLGFLQNSTKVEKDFYEFVATQGRVYRNKKGAFKESGTMVDTVTIEINTSSWKLNPYNGFKNFFVWHFMLFAYSDQKLADTINAIYTKEDFPKREDFENYCDQVLKHGCQNDELLSKNFINEYIEVLKRDCIDTREFQNLPIPQDEEISSSNLKKYFNNTKNENTEDTTITAQTVQESIKKDYTQLSLF